MKKVKCCECGGNFSSDVIATYTTDGEPMCESCYESEIQYPNSLLVNDCGSVKKLMHFGRLGWRDEYMDEVLQPDAVTKFLYKKTDGWRGYYYPELAEGYISVADGWSTGRWSDVPWKHTFNDFADKLFDPDEECYPPVPVYCAVGLTSNVFSVSTDLIIKESDLDTFTEWVSSEMGYKLEDLKRALS